MVGGSRKLDNLGAAPRFVIGDGFLRLMDAAHERSEPHDTLEQDFATDFLTDVNQPVAVDPDRWRAFNEHNRVKAMRHPPRSFGNNAERGDGSTPFRRGSTNSTATTTIKRGLTHRAGALLVNPEDRLSARHSKRIRPIASRYYPSLTGDVEAVAGANGARGGGLGNGTGHLTRSDIAHREVGF